MPPLPKAAPVRRNRIASAAQLEAPPATKVPLPQRYSRFKCVARIDRKNGCPLAGASHELEWFAKAEVEPHEFEPKATDWHEQTTLWWDTIWQSPMSRMWIDADVTNLLALAALWDDFWTAGNAAVMAEIRLQGREYGLSQLARRMLHWQVQLVDPPDPPAEDPDAPTPIASARRRRERKRDPRVEFLK